MKSASLFCGELSRKLQTHRTRAAGSDQAASPRPTYGRMCMWYGKGALIAVLAQNAGFVHGIMNMGGPSPGRCSHSAARRCCQARTGAAPPAAWVEGMAAEWRTVCRPPRDRGPRKLFSRKPRNQLERIQNWPPTQKVRPCIIAGV
jgi:hypothetical protein